MEYLGGICIPAVSFGHPQKGYVVCVSVLAGFMSEKRMCVRFGSTSCAGGVGFMEAWMVG